MSKHSKVPQPFIEDFQRKYFTAFPEVKRRIEWVQERLLEDGYLTTMFGRRRFFLKRRNDNKTLNEGCAFDPQSMTADEINNAMLRIYYIVKRRYPELQLLLQVHDSLLLQYPEHLEDEIIPWIKEAFRVELTLRLGRKFVVPCEVQTGWNWGYYNDNEARGELNLAGMRKYKGSDLRLRG